MIRQQHSRILLVLALAGSAAAADALPGNQPAVAAPEGLVQALGLDSRHRFQTRDRFTDDLGMTHTRVDRFYRGVRVWGGDLVLHAGAGGEAMPLSGPLWNAIDLPVDPALGAGEAVAVADRDLAPKGPYARPPRTELVVLADTVLRPVSGAPPARRSATDLERVPVGHRLAWHVHLSLRNGAAETLDRDYLVDARDGAILRSWDSLRTAARRKPVHTKGRSQYSGTVSIDASVHPGGGYDLIDPTRGKGGPFGGNAITNLDHGLTGPGEVYHNRKAAWGDGRNYEGGDTRAGNGQTAAVDAAYGLQTTWDYYRKVHKRVGVDGKNRATYMAVHYSDEYDNAFWDDDCFCMTFGDGSRFKSLEPLDVIGHEVSHGVCSATADLAYYGESGGLNEANSDINGTLVQFYAHGSLRDRIGDAGGDWTIGEAMVTPKFNRPLRYLYHPSLDGKSLDAWSEDLRWENVHRGSGPMNRCFYFLSQGAEREPGDSHSDYLPGGMAGLGNDRAARIWYRAMTVYMTSETDYAGARKAAVRAARDLYRAGSVEERAVWNAFHAINVGPAWGEPEERPKEGIGGDRPGHR